MLFPISCYFLLPSNVIPYLSLLSPPLQCYSLSLDSSPPLQCYSPSLVPFSSPPPSPLIFLCRHCALGCHDNTDAGLLPCVYHLGHCRRCTWCPWQPRVTADSLRLGDHRGGTLLLLRLLSAGCSALHNQVVSVSVCVFTKSCDSDHIIMWLGAHYHVARSTLSCDLEHIIMWLGVHYHVTWSTLSRSSEHIIM